MDTTLLQTKLYIPATRPSLVPRPSLIAKLNAGLGADGDFARKLTLVSAPAGFGKTTLVVEWGLQLQQAAQAQLCWLSLDEEDNDPQQFFSYLAVAIRPLITNPSSLSQHLQSPQPLPAKTLVKAFINDVVSVSMPFLLILDDFHFIQSAEISEAVAFLLDHLPAPMHLVITSRADPLLPLPRLRVRQQLTEIRAADLRLTEAETAVFLNDLRHLNLSAADIAALETRTEGWVAGLQLAALSLEKLGDSAKQAFVAALSGNDHYILDYLLDEVLRQQPAPIQDFLLKTAVLDRLTAPLCDALMEIGDWRLETNIPPSPIANLQSQNILEHLERANLFLVPLDNTRTWYRYHHLFADLLTNQLQASNKTCLPQLHQQASQWYEANGYLVDALTHAWKSLDFEYAVQLLKRHARNLLVRAELVTLVTWLGKLPPDRLAAQPQLCVYYAWATTTLLQLATAVYALTLVDAYTQATPLAAAELADWQGQTAVVRGLIASKHLDIPQMIALSQQGLAQLSPNNHLLRGLAISNLATAQWLSGHTAAACTELEAAIGINQEAGNITETINLMGIWAQSTYEMGQLQQTEQICRQGLRLIDSYSAQVASSQPQQQAQGGLLPSAGLIYVQLGQLFREWNRLDEAVGYVQRGIELSKTESIGNVLMLRMLLAVLQGSQGDEAGSLAELAEIQRLSQRMTLPRIMEYAKDIQAFIHLQKGEITAVNQWITATQISAHDSPSHFLESRYLIFSQALLQQKRWPEAERLLSTLQPMAEKGGRTGRLIHIFILSALAHQLQGQTRQATAVLQQALSLAEPEKPIRIFLDTGTPIADILKSINPANDQQHAYIQTLLAAFATTAPVPSAHLSPRSPVRIESLSERELEILKLVANGRSNRQIAADLYLALGTVKKHISNIFGKLQATNRTQAVARARKTNLI